MFLESNKFIAIVLMTLSLSFIFCFLIVQLHKFFKFKDRSIYNIQTAHSSSTPRLGGVAMLLSLFVVEIIFGGLLRGWFLYAILPIFVIGLLEDFHIQTSAKLRLLVAAISSLIAILLKSSRIFLLFDIELKILSLTFLVSSNFGSWGK